jgi:transposase
MLSSMSHRAACGVGQTISKHMATSFHNPLQGRLRTLSATQMYALMELIETAPAMFLDKLQDWLGLEHDIFISITALHNSIKQAGLSYKLLRCRAANAGVSERIGCLTS